jgi:hypothetical protein
MKRSISPIDPPRARNRHWLLRIWEFDALEIHPCAVIGYDSAGKEIVETCAPKEADFWTVYGHNRTGGVDAFEDFATVAEAGNFHDRLVEVYPHLRVCES